MKDDRNRVLLDANYAHALGVAAFCFARCEWGAVWCCERLKPGYIHTVEPEKKTAGKVARDLITLVNSIPDAKLRAICKGPADEFKRLADERNGVFHGKPGSTPENDQRLFRSGAPWTIERVEEVADRFAACDIAFSDILHNHLVPMSNGA